MRYQYCPKCNYARGFGERMTLYGKEKHEPVKFCTQCGSQMINACQHCGRHRASMKDRFCPGCGNPYK